VMKDGVRERSLNPYLMAEAGKPALPTGAKLWTGTIAPLPAEIEGPRNLRVLAEIKDATERHHAFAIDLGPYAVGGNPPPPKPDWIDVVSPRRPGDPANGTGTKGPSTKGPGTDTKGPGTDTRGGTTIPGQTRPIDILTGPYLIADSRLVRAGQTVSIPIRLANSPGVANLNFDLSYNSSVAKPEGDPAKGNLLAASTLFTANIRPPGQARVGFAGREPTRGFGTVTEITFRATGKPGDETPLTLIVTSVNNESGAPVKLGVSHGVLRIVPDSLLGDADGDGVLTALDAMAALEMSVGNRPMDLALDVNQDRTVTSLDAAIILRRALGLKE